MILIKENIDYVKKIVELEKSGITKSVLPYLSSLYFPAKAIRRYFEGKPGGEEISDLLIQRVDSLEQDGSLKYDIYESSAFKDVIKQGLVHSQDRNYRITPREIIYVLNRILDLIYRKKIKVAITSEVLPIAFSVFPRGAVLIDIKANYDYQKIQGILIDDPPEVGFEAEFDRLWDGCDTVNDQAKISGLIKASIIQWEQYGTVELSMWPEMRVSDDRG